MTGRDWRASRLALVAAALAVLAGTPAILAAATVRNPWYLAGATAGAAVVVVFGAVWQQRYQQVVQHRGEQEFRVQAGCLVLASGRLPTVGDVIDPVALGVHRAGPLGGTAGNSQSSSGMAPAYVPRDVDEELRERLAAGGFVLLVGDSTAGKSRTAFEAVSATLAGHLLIAPSRGAIAVAVERAAGERRCALCAVAG